MTGGRTETAGILVRWLARTSLLLLWALVGWGTLMILATMVAVAREGPRAVLLRLLPPPHASIWGWLNLLAPALAALAWVTVAAIAFRTRGRRSPQR